MNRELAITLVMVALFAALLGYLVARKIVAQRDVMDEVWGSHGYGE